jgi:demethylmenaquinone methyltransferase/2-methoxy-6-polyprenyl-1,4-benzoquinol methylase
MTDALDVERVHEDQWYRRVVAEGFFEREGFRRLVAANLSALERLVAVASSTRVLSLGCGTGEYERRLATKCRSVVGADLSPVAIEYASRRARDDGQDNLSFACGPIDALAIAPASIDLVVIFGVLHHLDAAQRTAVYALVQQWLAPGGWCYARDPNARGLLRRLAGPFARHDEFHSPNEAALDPRAIASEWREAGFQALRLDYTDVLSGPLPWVLPASSSLIWGPVFAFDRVWLAVPPLRPLASQFAIAGQREPAP